MKTALRIMAMTIAKQYPIMTTYDRTITSAIQPKQYSRTREQQQDKRTNTKTIMVIDDDPDTTLTFKKSLEEENYNISDKISIEVHPYNYPDFSQ